MASSVHFTMALFRAALAQALSWAWEGGATGRGHWTGLMDRVKWAILMTVSRYRS